ncbi:ATP synthase F1 subunit gamma [bacterium]|nr:ATP synthase F1 subunit gamma [bacterium]NUN45846.1 ATP synthase F1 subunit gamma [bacterium]HMV25525.1 ATP synthase F1 subunit gamma [bacterium]HMW33681.1 ATP synthase F1 subunit gamma [bacterium]HMW36735.1 ATP synthase F1 subunit gamma [bacterium]
MATLREIKRRIVSVKSTQKITKAMKMVAAAKLRRAQENIISARPYAYKLGALIKHLARNEEVQQNPLIKPRDVKNIMIVVVTADRSLCGAFNTNIIRYVNNLLKGDLKSKLDNNNVKLVTVGRKGDEFFTKRHFPVVFRHANFFNHLNFDDASKVITYCVQEYSAGRVDEVHVVYNEFKSAIQQNLVMERLLPVEPEKVESSNVKYNIETDYIYEPSQYEIINTLIPRHLNVQMWRILLESFAAEMGARMTAMESATENAGDLIRTLTLYYNRARQAAITKEILEVVSGAEALRK